MKIKEFVLYSVFSALVVAIYLLLPPLYLLVFTIIVLSLDMKSALLLGLITGIITGIVHPKFLTFTNAIWLPLIAFGLKIFEQFIYGGKLKDGCLSKPNKYMGLRLGFVSFIFIFLANLGSEVIASIIQNLGFLYVILSLPMALGLALVTSIIIGFIGIPLQKRLSKLIYQLNS